MNALGMTHLQTFIVHIVCREDHGYASIEMSRDAAPQTRLLVSPVPSGPG